jgi:hypothetical protein
MRDKKASSDLRQKHNSDLIRRMRNGEALNAVDSKASWFPPRPIIQKDEREMARLYANAKAKEPKSIGGLTAVTGRDEAPAQDLGEAG